MSVAVCIVTFMVVCVFVFRPFVTAKGRIGERDAGPGGGTRLVEEREALVDAIRELDFDYRMGKVEEDDYRATRSRYESRAVELMRVIEETAGPAPGIEDRIEEEIAAMRKKDTVICAGCGRATPEGARFCPQCGTALAGSHP
ncbi:MAG: zinc ribbon domain-containing protein [Gemmatimonadota bacterium]|nr:zinc ribbon domain-containing protein [Gemmatimonadota bacterium]